VTETRHADEGFHEIQLNGKQLVFLFMATTVVAVVIFLCGVLVGRGVRAERAPAGDAAAAADVAPLAPASGDPAPASRGAEDLSYHRRLQGDAASTASAAMGADDQLKPREAPAPAEVAPPGRTAAIAPQTPTGAAGREAQDEAGWVVQIAALRDRAAADVIVRRLAGRGYPAFLVAPAQGAPAPGYRVRVGRYTDRREAERIARRLEREEQFRPFITR
jgi:cell division septation protein DedD